MTDDFITLVVHTPERAAHLAGILSFHGIANRLEQVSSEVDMPVLPQRVLVSVSQLPLALRILESGEDYSSAQIMLKMAGMSGVLLIPVDFSQKSFMAVRTGFLIARRVGLKPVILHAWLAPDFPGDSLDISSDPSLIVDDIAVEQENEQVSQIVAAKFNVFMSAVKSAIRTGDIPDISFSTSLIEGVAEEVILEYCRLNSPSLVVMATRDREHKESDLIGSVAAEVVDSCRVPVLTIPDGYSGVRFDKITDFVLFCTLGRHDVVTMRTLMKSLNYPVCNVYLVPLADKLNDSMIGKLHDLKSFFMANYPTARFHEYLANKEFCSDVDTLVSDHNVGLMIVPNKKTNVFSRIFRPTLAHRCLFQHDMPMLFIPV